MGFVLTFENFPEVLLKRWTATLNLLSVCPLTPVCS